MKYLFICITILILSASSFADDLDIDESNITSFSCKRCPKFARSSISSYGHLLKDGLIWSYIGEKLSLNIRTELNIHCYVFSVNQDNQLKVYLSDRVLKKDKKLCVTIEIKEKWMKFYIILTEKQDKELVKLIEKDNKYISDKNMALLDKKADLQNIIYRNTKCIIRTE